MTTTHAQNPNQTNTRTGWLYRDYLSVIAHNVQTLRFRIMMSEMTYVVTTREAMRMLKPKRHMG